MKYVMRFFVLFASIGVSCAFGQQANDRCLEIFTLRVTDTSIWSKAASNLVDAFDASYGGSANACAKEQAACETCKSKIAHWIEHYEAADTEKLRAHVCYALMPQNAEGIYKHLTRPYIEDKLRLQFQKAVTVYQQRCPEKSLARDTVVKRPEPRDICDLNRAQLFVSARIKDCPLTTTDQVGAAERALAAAQDEDIYKGTWTFGTELESMRPATSCLDYERAHDNMESEAKKPKSKMSQALIPYWRTQAQLAFRKCPKEGIQIGNNGMPLPPRPATGIIAR